MDRTKTQVSGEQYLATMDAQLDEWDARLGALEAQVEAARTLRADIARRLDEVRFARGEHLGSLQAGLALAWRRFTAQIDGGRTSERPGR